MVTTHNLNDNSFQPGLYFPMCMCLSDWCQQQVLKLVQCWAGRQQTAAMQLLQWKHMAKHSLWIWPPPVFIWAAVNGWTADEEKEKDHRQRRVNQLLQDMKLRNCWCSCGCCDPVGPQRENTDGVKSGSCLYISDLYRQNEELQSQLDEDI